MHVQEEFVSVFSAVSCQVLVGSSKVSFLPPPAWTTPAFSAYPPPSCCLDHPGRLFHVCGGLGSGAVSVAGDGTSRLVPVRSFSKQAPPVPIWPHLWPKLHQSASLQINLFKKENSFENIFLFGEPSFVLEGLGQKEK